MARSRWFNLDADDILVRIIQISFQSFHGPTHVNWPQDTLTALNEVQRLDANNNHVNGLNAFMNIGRSCIASDYVMFNNSVASTAAASWSHILIDALLSSYFDYLELLMIVKSSNDHVSAKEYWNLPIVVSDIWKNLYRDDHYW